MKGKICLSNAAGVKQTARKKNRIWGGKGGREKKSFLYKSRANKNEGKKGGGGKTIAHSRNGRRAAREYLLIMVETGMEKKRMRTAS